MGSNDLDEDNKQLSIQCLADALAIAEKLIEYGADVNAKTDVNDTPISSLTCRGFVDIINVLLASGAEVNVHGYRGSTPLHNAAGNGYCDVIKILLSKGATIDAQDMNKNTSLHYASCNGHINTVKTLLLYGADATIRNYAGKTAADVAKSDDIREHLTNYLSEVDIKEPEETNAC